jgi:hypothetical protein
MVTEGAMTLQECIDRTIEQRDKFAALPEHVIELDIAMEWNARTVAELPTKGQPASHTPCNSVGCLLGWLTIDLAQRDLPVLPANHLGLIEHRTKSSDEMFRARRKFTMSQRDEGLARYDHRLRELYARQAEEEIR